MNTRATSFSPQELSGRFKPISSTSNSPELDAVLQKMVSDQRRGTSPRQRANISTRGLTNGTLQRISQRTSADIQDAKSLFQILPDLELAMQILISSILSPKDLGRGKLGYTVETGRFNSEVTGKMVKAVETFFDNTYRINDLLPEILEDVLFFRGSYPMMVIPENAIDEIINRPERVSFESISDSSEYKRWMTDSIGLLGPSQLPSNLIGRMRSGMEDFGSSSRIGEYKSEIMTNPKKDAAGKDVAAEDLFIRVVDNPDILKRARLEERLRRERVADVLNQRHLGNRLRRGSKIQIEHLPKTPASLRPGTEAVNASQMVGGNGVGVYGGGGQASFTDHALYRARRNYRSSQVAQMPSPDTLTRATVGHPLVSKLPSEAVIPVHVPGDPKDHVGYFVLLDEYGNPVNYEHARDYYSDMGMMLSQNTNMTSQIIQTNRRTTNGTQDPVTAEEVRQLEEAYIDLVETDLNRRLKNGIYGGNVEVARPTEVYRMMLARTYKQRQTQLLYVPAEMLTYIAFDYNEYGIGVSLLQKSKIVGGIRATLLFANTMSSIKNSIARTRLHITLDPDDPEPDMTVEEYIHNYVRNSRGMLPIGVNEPNDIVAHLNNAAVEIEVDGDNPMYPNTKMLVENYAGDKAKPDTELEDSMRDRHLMAIGVPPELIANAKNLEFATQIVQNNTLMTRRVMTYQDKFLPFLEEFVVRYVANSQPLMDELREIVRANVDRLSRAQLTDQAEAVADGAVEVEDEDLKKLVSTVKDANEDDSVKVDSVVFEFLQALRLTLPSPETNLIKNQQESLNIYDEMLTKILDYHFSGDFLTQEVMGEMSDAVDSTKAAIKAHMMRQYCRSNNILPEMDDLTIFNSDEGPALDLFKVVAGHEDGLRATLLSYMKHVHEMLKKTNKQYADSKEQLGDAAGGGGDFSGGGDAGGFSDPTGGGGDEFGDMGMGDMTAEIPTGEEGDSSTTSDGDGDATDTGEEEGEEGTDANGFAKPDGDTTF